MLYQVVILPVFIKRKKTYCQELLPYSEYCFIITIFFSQISTVHKGHVGVLVYTLALSFSFPCTLFSGRVRQQHCRWMAGQYVVYCK